MGTNISQLTQEQLEQIKAKLLESKLQVQEELEKFGHKKDGTYEALYPELGNKDDENAEEVAEFGVNLGVEETLTKRLRDIVKAVERIEKGKYGVCNHCGKVINPQRLIARPESGSCVECKERMMQV